MHKGPDTLRVNIAQVKKALSGHLNTNDEVLMFQTFRYLSAGEAFYRTANFDMHHSDVGCTRLTVHLEGKDWVGKDMGDKSSRLLEYFQRPQPALDDLLYTEYFARHNVAPATDAELEAHEANGEALYKPDAEARQCYPYYIDNCEPPNKVAVRSGMPLGMQIVAPAWREDWCLRVAAALEQRGLLVAKHPSPKTCA